MAGGGWREEESRKGETGGFFRKEKLGIMLRFSFIQRRGFIPRVVCMGMDEKDGSQIGVYVLFYATPSLLLRNPFWC